VIDFVPPPYWIETQGFETFVFQPIYRPWLEHGARVIVTDPRRREVMRWGSVVKAHEGVEVLFESVLLIRPVSNRFTVGFRAVIGPDICRFAF
jgi:hypothetical protein